MQAALSTVTEPGAWAVSSEIARLVSLLALLALIGFVAARLRRASTRHPRRTRRIHVIERAILEPRRSVYLLEVDGSTLLVGVSERGLHSLKLPTPAGPEEIVGVLHTDDCPTPPTGLERGGAP